MIVTLIFASVGVLIAVIRAKFNKDMESAGLLFAEIPITMLSAKLMYFFFYIPYLSYKLVKANADRARVKTEEQAELINFFSPNNGTSIVTVSS
jgi:hypothetical protein